MLNAIKARRSARAKPRVCIVVCSLAAILVPPLPLQAANLPSSEHCTDYAAAPPQSYTVAMPSDGRGWHANELLIANATDPAGATSVLATYELSSNDTSDITLTRSSAFSDTQQDFGPRKLLTSKYGPNLALGANELAPRNADLYSLSDFGLQDNGGSIVVSDILRWIRTGTMTKEVTQGEISAGDKIRLVTGQPAVVVYRDADGSRRTIAYVTMSDGYLHAIDTQTAQELWAFAPVEILTDIGARAMHTESSGQFRGLLGDAVIARIDRDGNNAVDEGDRATLVVGMGTGGSAYYALDVSSRNNPMLLWRTVPTLAGQATGRAMVATVAIDPTEQLAPRPVVIIGTGEPDRNAGDADQPANSATGGVSAIDLRSGEEVWRAGPDSGADLRLPGMSHPINRQVKAIDLTGDGRIDRMYSIDAAGQVWRFDVTDTKASQVPVNGGLIGQLGEDDASDGNTRLLFPFAPDVSIVQDSMSGRSYMAINVGAIAVPVTGDGAPKGHFYSLWDPHVYTPLLQAEYDRYEPVTATQLSLTGSGSEIEQPRGWKHRWPAGQLPMAASLSFDSRLYIVTAGATGGGPGQCRGTTAPAWLHRLRLDSGAMEIKARVEPAANEARRAPSSFGRATVAARPLIWLPPMQAVDCEAGQCSTSVFVCVATDCFDTGYVNRPVRTTWKQDGVR